MPRKIKSGRRERLTFSKLPLAMDVPDLIDIQRRSYAEFMQSDRTPEERRNVGLEEVFQYIFPIKDFKEKVSLSYLGYSVGNPKFDVDECQERDMTFSAPLKIKVEMIVREIDPTSKAVTVSETKVQEVYMGELPLMTNKGTFIINGAERVIVSQLHRTPGVSFKYEVENRQARGRKVYSTSIIPYRGTWLSFEVDDSDLLYLRINRKRRFLATVFFRAMGYQTDSDILRLFYETEVIQIGEDRATLVGRIVVGDVVDQETGEIILEANEAVTEDNLNGVVAAGIKEIEIITYKQGEFDLSISNSLRKDPIKTYEEAMVDIYKKLRFGDIPTQANAQSVVEKYFFSTKRYDLSKVGRYKLNKKLKLEDNDERALRKKDIYEVVKYLINLKNGIGNIGDIDHLGNRRVRSAGELLKNQIRVGLSRMERTIKERMTIQATDTVMPSTLINAKPVTVAIKEFFGSSQLSQFMDQTNPLSELTHKRRLSALGPGGLNRERAGFDVRDVHHTHYGRVCPIETPEGPNIGLIVSLSSFARVNEYGFIESPYRKVKSCKVSDEIAYLAADEEDDYFIAQSNAALDENNKFAEKSVLARNKGDFPRTPAKDIRYMDVSPMQLVSVATSLIPFLEHDDANRALMGSNMQRQAVPLLKTQAPFVGTGMEYRSARDSGAVIVARRDGQVVHVSSKRIVVHVDEAQSNVYDCIDEYRMIKYHRSNQDTCINQKPILLVGDRVTAGDILADGFSTEQGELALGQNVLVAFMPWRGFNFEDAIIISEELVKRDIFTSVHIEEYEIEARDTKLGKEEITRDIPNVSEEALRNLDENGVIRIGAEVKPGDILVGKVTPKGETELSPEEKLLRAIFGEKAGDVRDASLKAYAGNYGTVIDVKVFARTDSKDVSFRKRLREKIRVINEEFAARNKDVDFLTRKQLHIALDGQQACEGLKNPISEEVILARGATITPEIIDQSDVETLLQVQVADEECCAQLRSLSEKRSDRLAEFEAERTERVEKMKKGDDLPPGVIKLVKVYIAKKRKISVGDKMAGRHGNKGVIARILPVEDMPCLKDGTPVEIILNPLGVPSRMNVGQLMETHLGWACHELGVHIATPVFDGASEDEIKDMLIEAKLPSRGQITLYDGYTGDAFDGEVTVGYIYMLKLAHLVDNKIHARSIGPYSLVTQQPLGGKSQFGGQRFGEMEVWALEAYGVSYLLQEMLTVKSDDVAGRTKIYESIVKGENTLEPGIPESFNVLEKELMSLCLNIERIE